MTEKDNFTLDNPIMFDKKNGRCRCIPIPYEKDMTEKRFKQVVNGVKDTRTGRTLTSPLEFTLKLNEINDLYDCVFDRNEELENENEQLKQSYAQLEHRHSLLHDECLDAECDRDSYHKDVLSLEKENEQLKSENKRLTDKLNQTALELVDGCISQGKATEISEMSYREFLDYRAKNGKPMELQK